MRSRIKNIETQIALFCKPERKIYRATLRQGEELPAHLRNLPEESFLIIQRIITDGTDRR